MSTSDRSEEGRAPPGWFHALAGGVSGGASALVFESALWVGLGTGAGVVLFVILWWTGSALLDGG